MKRCLLDTNVISLLWGDKTPEKWSRIWREIRMGQRGLILIEPLVSEMYYKNILKFGKKGTKDKILGLKSLKKVDIYPLNDNDAINAGAIKVDYSSSSLSLVDCFLLSVAKKQNALILTTDYPIRNVARKLKVDVSFLPFKES